MTISTTGKYVCLLSIALVCGLSSCVQDNYADPELEGLTKAKADMNDLERAKQVDATHSIDWAQLVPENPPSEGECAFPGYPGPESCGAEMVDPALVSYGQCIEMLYGEPGWNEENNIEMDDEFLAMYGIVFYTIVQAAEADQLAGGHQTRNLDKAIECLKEIIAAEAIDALIKGLKKGKLNKKALGKLIKKSLKKLVGFWTICEFAWCYFT